MLDSREIGDGRHVCSTIATGTDRLRRVDADVLGSTDAIQKKSWIL